MQREHLPRGNNLPTSHDAKVQQQADTRTTSRARLEVTRRIHWPAWRMVPVGWRCQTLRACLFPPDAVVARVEEVVLRNLLPLLLAPQPPCHERNTTDQDRATNATYYASNNLLARS